MSNPTPLVPDLQAAFSDHDRLFKELLTIFFADFLAPFAPALAARVDMESAVFLNQEVFTVITDGSRRIVDLLVRVTMRGDEGREAFILIQTAITRLTHRLILSQLL